MNLQNLPEQDLEKLLQALPQYQMSKKKELVFYAKLMKLARDKKRLEQKDAREERIGLPFWNLRRTFAFATFGIFALFIATVGFSLSPKVTRGHFLYQIKQTEERAELAFARDPLSRVSAHMRFAGRRLSELEALFKGNPELLRLISVAKAHEKSEIIDPRINETLDDYYRETSAATKEIPKIQEPEKAVQALEKVEIAQEKHVKKLEILLPKASAVGRMIVAEVLVTVEEHRTEIIEKKIEVIRKREEGEKKVEVSVKSVEEIAAEVRKEPEAALARFEKREEQAKEEFEHAKTSLEKLKQKFVKTEEKAEEATKFEAFVDQRLKEAEKALSEGNFGKVSGLSRASTNMTNRFTPPEDENRKEKKRDGASLGKDEPIEPEAKPEPETKEEKKIIPEVQRYYTPQVTSPQVFRKFLKPIDGQPISKHAPYDSQRELSEKNHRSLMIGKITLILQKNGKPVPENLAKMSDAEIDTFFHTLSGTRYEKFEKNEKDMVE